MSSFGFIIAACLRTAEHAESLNSCIKSIQSNYHLPKIVVVVDFSSAKALTDMIMSTHSDVLFEVDTPHVPADMLLLSYFKEKKYFDIALTIQDSMRLKKKIEIPEHTDIHYLWYFTNHRVHWAILEEPKTDFNISNGIKTHDDLNHYVINNLLESQAFKLYCLEKYDSKYEWSGCFGCCCMISHDFLIKLDNETKILDLMHKMTTNRLRRSIESIFSLACQFTKDTEIHSAIDGLYYDGFSGNQMNGEHIQKISFDRQ
jgi:hypothetical protein